MIFGSFVVLVGVTAAASCRSRVLLVVSIVEVRCGAGGAVRPSRSGIGALFRGAC